MNAEIPTIAKTKIIKRLANFELAKNVYPANLRMPSHAHELAHISVVLGGSYTERHDNQERFASSSMLVFHPPGEKHSVEFHNKGAQIFNIQIKSKWLENIREVADLFDTPNEFNDGAGNHFAARIYREFQRMDKYSALAIEGLILEMIAELSREKGTHERKIPRWLENVRELLHARLSEEMEMPEITKIAGVHPVHLAREFRKFYQCTMGEYVRRLRVKSACAEISKSKIPLSEIALKYGFYDQSHLTNSFKQITGMTPAQYRSVFRQSS